MNKKCLDIFLSIIDYLDVKSATRLLMCCPTTRDDKQSYMKALTIKSLVELNMGDSIVRCINTARKQLSSNDKTELFKVVYKMRVYFMDSTHLDASISDFLIFLVDNECDDTPVFHLLFDKLSVNIMLSKTRKHNSLCITDAVYIITHCHPCLLQYITRCGVLPVEIISEIILNIVSKSAKEETGVYDRKIRDLISYLFVKHCFKKFSTNGIISLNNILNNLIETNDIRNIKYIMTLRNKYAQGNTSDVINYNMCINKAISFDNIEALQLLFDDREQEPILVKPNSIETMFQKEEFKCLEYLVTNLGNVLSMNKYFTSILTGLYKQSQLRDIDWTKLSVLRYVLCEEQLNKIECLKKTNFIRV